MKPSPVVVVLAAVAVVVVVLVVVVVGGGFVCAEAVVALASPTQTNANIASAALFFLSPARFARFARFVFFCASVMFVAPSCPPTPRPAASLGPTTHAGYRSQMRWLLVLASCASLAIGAVVAIGCKNEERPAVADLARTPPSASLPRDAGGEGGAVAGALFGTASPPRAIAVDSSSIYVSFGRGTAPDGGAFEGSIAVAPRGGGEPVTIVTGGSPTELLRVGTSLVWIDEGTAIGTGGVFAVELAAGATPRALLSNLEAPSAIASDGTQILVSSRGPSLAIAIDSVPLAGGAGQNITTTLVGEIAPAGIALDAKNVYFVGISRFGGTLFRAPLAGGLAEVLWTPASGAPGDVAVADGRAFVTLEASADASSIVSVPVNGGPATPLLTGLDHPARLAIADTDLYWTNQDPARGAVSRASIAVAAPEATLLRDRIDSPHAIAVADAVYVTASAAGGKGAVYKFPK
jgi:hypothetical protein